MNTEELSKKIELLKSAAEKLNGTSKTFILDDIYKLEIKLKSMEMDEIVSKIGKISLPEITELNKNIESAVNSINQYNDSVISINKAVNFIKKLVGID